MNSCLVLIDIQDGFLTDKTKHIISNLEDLLGKKRFTHIVGTKFKNYDKSPYIRLMNWHGLKNSQEQKVHSFVEKNVEVIFEKNIYTCFTDEFKTFLKEKNIDKLIFAGIDLDCCVLKSAVDALEAGYDIEVLLNCCATNGGKESFDAAVCVLKRLIGNNQINNS
ncbi:MAG: cysteine hydrolase [Acidaminococcaceae bacterium]|nr:cysteine hydrolase [Acidaminococcaceae bacterium]